MRDTIERGSPAGGREYLETISIWISVAFALAPLFALLLALTPRTEVSSTKSRYAFPDLAAQAAGYVPPLDVELQREEAWHQARILAVIALKKFKFFRLALNFFAVAASFLVIAYLVAP